MRINFLNLIYLIDVHEITEIKINYIFGDSNAESFTYRLDLSDESTNETWVLSVYLGFSHPDACPLRSMCRSIEPVRSMHAFSMPSFTIVRCIDRYFLP